MTTNRSSNPVRRWSLALAVQLAVAIALPAANLPSRATSSSPPLSPQATLELAFRPNNGIRTLVAGAVAVPVSQVRANPLGFYNLALQGEVQVEGRSYDRFSYRFDVPASSGSSAPLSLAFERVLRPGTFQLTLQVEDLHGGAVSELAQTLVVPRLSAVRPGVPGERGGGSSTRPASSLERSSASAAHGGAAAASPAGAGNGGSPAAPPLLLASAPPVRLVPPPAVAVGKQRFEALANTPQVARVVFLLDGRPVLSRLRPPFAVELDLGPRPVLRRLQVEAYGEDGVLLGEDRVELNAGAVDRFAVRLARSGTRGDRVTARAEVAAPNGQQVARVELFLDEQRVAVFQRPPFARELAVAGGRPAVLRAVATLADGSTAEDSLLLNAPNAAAIDVELVELYAAVVDRRNRPVRGLPASRFRVFEEGRQQQLERFAEVRDLPLNAVLLLDTSGSMVERLAEVRAAALAFLKQIVTPRDRVAVVTFDNAPRMRTDFTSDLAFLANGLEALRAAGGTALHDSLLFAMEQLHGAQGQRVLVLLSDGVDERSSATAAQVMELARRSATTIYTIGLEDPRPLAPVLDRPLLTRLAEETGGRSFFAHRADELRHAYDEIEREVRSRYLLSYYSDGEDRGSFRLVSVELDQPGVSARTIRGYYP